MKIKTCYFNALTRDYMQKIYFSYFPYLYLSAALQLFFFLFLCFFLLFPSLAATGGKKKKER